MRSSNLVHAETMKWKASSCVGCLCSSMMLRFCLISNRHVNLVVRLARLSTSEMRCSCNSVTMRAPEAQYEDVLYGLFSS